MPEDDGVFGVCQPGTLRCDVEAEGGTFGCQSNINPGDQQETCANRNEDNDCDGNVIDLFVEGDPDAEERGACTTGRDGICAAGTYQCEGKTVVCVQTNEERGQDQICTEMDENCNGEVDENNDFLDPATCGDCNTSCAQAEGCCPERIEDEDTGACSPLDADLNCGGCGFSNGSVTQFNCTDQGRLCCDGDCIDTDTDEEYCGSCDGEDRECTDDQLCCGGSCVDRDETNCVDCGIGCNEGFECCDGTCVTEDTCDD